MLILQDSDHWKNAPSQRYLQQISHYRADRHNANSGLQLGMATGHEDLMEMR